MTAVFVISLFLLEACNALTRALLTFVFATDPRVISSFYKNIAALTSEQKQYPVVVIATTHHPRSLSDDMHQCFLHELVMEASILVGVLCDAFAFSDNIKINCLWVCASS